MAATVQQQFSCHVERDGTRTRMVPRGELDLSTVDAFRIRIDEALADGTGALTVDLRPLSFVDSSGLRSLLALAERTRRDGVELELVPGPPSVMRLFEITGTTAVLPFVALR